MVLEHGRPGPKGSPLMTVPVSMSTTMWEGIQKKAKASGMKGELYLRLLLEAAYTARVNPQGDAEMERAVARAFRTSKPVSPPVMVTVSPQLPEPGPTREAIVHLAEAAAAKLLEEVPVAPEPAPVAQQQPLSRPQLQAIRAYRGLGWLPRQIAEALKLDIEQVREVAYPGRRS